MAGANDFVFPGHVDKIVVDRRSALPEFRIARSLHADSLEQAHALIHVAAEISGVGSGDGFEMLDEIRGDVVRQLPRQLRLPVRRNAFGKQRRELLLDLVLELEVQRFLLSRMPLAQFRRCFPRIVIAVVKEENDLPADLLLKPVRRGHLGVKKTLGEKTARLLTETDDRLSHGVWFRQECLRTTRPEIMSVAKSRR